MQGAKGIGLKVASFSLSVGVSSFSLLAMLDQTASLGSGPESSPVGSKRLLACSAMVSRSLTRAAQLGLAWKKLAKRRVFADLAAAGFKELGEIFFELCGGHVVEVGCGEVFHRAASVKAFAGWRDCGSRRSSRSLRRALWSWDLLLPVEHSSMVAISLCSKPSTSWRTKTMR